MRRYPVELIIQLLWICMVKYTFGDNKLILWRIKRSLNMGESYSQSYSHQFKMNSSLILKQVLVIVWHLMIKEKCSHGEKVYKDNWVSIKDRMLLIQGKYLSILCLRFARYQQEWLIQVLFVIMECFWCGDRTLVANWDIQEKWKKVWYLFCLEEVLLFIRKNHLIRWSKKRRKRKKRNIWLSMIRDSSTRMWFVEAVRHWLLFIRLLT